MKTTCLLFTFAFAITSCEEKPTGASATPPPAAETSGILKTVLATVPNDNPASIHATRATAKPGEEVTLKGRVIGNAKPFVDGRSAFVLGDPEILSACNDKPGDECDTPWDSCCNTPEEKKRGTATIQIVGMDGRVLKEPVEDVGGISKLANLTITGKVAESSTPDLLIVNATAIKAITSPDSKGAH